MLRPLLLGLLGVGLGTAIACGEPDATPYVDPGTGAPAVNPDGTTVASTGHSCNGATGADKKCGNGSQDCCAVAKVPGGTFNRFNDTGFPATVSPFSLDVFELTAGRFRAWVDLTNGDLRSHAPPEGGGAHPKIAGSGWRTEWNQFLPSSRADVDRMLGPEDTQTGFPACQYGTNIDDSGALTWWTDALENKVRDRNRSKPQVVAENTKDSLDRKPLNCIPWYVLFAFCVWDGGRLPTDAEFGFAYAAGEEQRPFPWGAVDPQSLVRFADRNDLSLVPVFDPGNKFVVARLYDRTRGPNVFEDNYSFTYGAKTMDKSDNAAHIGPVGQKPLGNGKWGHADLAGGMFEWMLDEGPIRPGQCNDCANVNWPVGDAKDPDALSNQEEFQNKGGMDWFKGGTRAIRGSAWDNSVGIATGQSRTEIEYYTSYPVKRTYRAIGGRCARDL
jgi:formylglycine-generating enzyme required for sulfatase activity